MQIDQRIEQNPIVSGHDMKDDLQSNARNNFIRKVYTILSLQLLTTCAFTILAMFIPDIYFFLKENTSVLVIAFIISFVSIILLACCPSIATRSPINIIVLSIFTLAESYLVASIATLYTPASILNAAIATLGATIGLTLYAIKTKSDFSDSYSKCYGFFWSLFFVSLTLVILNVFFIQSEALSILMAIGFSALYSFYLIIDTQLIMGGRNQEFSLDNYVLGAAMLYIDIVTLFLEILRIIGDRN